MDPQPPPPPIMMPGLNRRMPRVPRSRRRHSGSGPSLALHLPPCSNCQRGIYFLPVWSHDLAGFPFQTSETASDQMLTGSPFDNGFLGESRRWLELAQKPPHVVAHPLKKVSPVGQRLESSDISIYPSRFEPTARSHRRSQRLESPSLVIRKPPSSWLMR